MDVLFLKLSLPYGISSCKFNENYLLRENTKMLSLLWKTIKVLLLQGGTISLTQEISEQLCQWSNVEIFNVAFL